MPEPENTGKYIDDALRMRADGNRFAFAVVDDTRGIDGVQETDSIDVTNISLGEGFLFGAFIVQDGMDTTADPDDTETNFKWLRWEDIAVGLGDQVFTSAYNPRVSTNRRLL